LVFAFIAVSLSAFYEPMIALLALVVLLFYIDNAFYSIHILSDKILLSMILRKQEYAVGEFSEYFFSGMGVGQRVHLCFSGNRRHVFFTPGEREAFIAELDAILERNRRESRKNKSKD
jgi:hypothetical protein